MKKLRIGIWISENFVPESGGGFGYYQQIINKISVHQFENTEIIFLTNLKTFKLNTHHKIIHIDDKSIINHGSILYKVRRSLSYRLNLTTKLKYEQDLIKVKHQFQLQQIYKIVDLIYYPVPESPFTEIPFIYTLWDVGHLSMFAFPEVTMKSNFEKRKLHHDFIPHKALLVFVESEQGKRDAVRYLNLNEDRIKVIPIFASEIISDKVPNKRPSLINSECFFIHYPAQFWSHKNHYNLLVAFKTVLETFPKLKLVFCGSDKGNKNYITDVIVNLELTDSVIDLGFIEMAELKWLYKNSQGLVMPSFLGPTNMPLLEAASLNCAVCCSNLAGHKEQLGNYAYYFDPLNPAEISQMICKMIFDKQNGEIRNYHSIFNIDNALMQIEKSFKEIESIRFCWGENDKSF
jgi:glycosyltransferase involved in cell wall biosynthesis